MFALVDPCWVVSHVPDCKMFKTSSMLAMSLPASTSVSRSPLAMKLVSPLRPILFPIEDVIDPPDSCMAALFIWRPDDPSLIRPPGFTGSPSAFLWWKKDTSKIPVNSFTNSIYFKISARKIFFFYAILRQNRNQGCTFELFKMSWNFPDLKIIFLLNFPWRAATRGSLYSSFFFQKLMNYWNKRKREMSKLCYPVILPFRTTSYDRFQQTGWCWSFQFGVCITFPAKRDINIKCIIFKILSSISSLSSQNSARQTDCPFS